MGQEVLGICESDSPWREQVWLPGWNGPLDYDDHQWKKTATVGANGRTE